MSAKSSERERVYSAAELFHLPARFFNDALVEGLENEGISVFSPQRNGFEFSQLGTVLAKYLPPEEIGEVLNVLIYAYDIKSMQESDVVVARFDEPSDPGVDTEVLFANVADIPVVAYRTDVRSPYGNYSDRFAGMHSFPIKESQVFIIQESSNSSRKDLQNLVGKIVAEVKTVLKSASLRDKEKIPKAYKKIFEIIDVLFEGIDIHTEEGLIEVVKRYTEHKELLHAFGPRVVR